MTSPILSRYQSAKKRAYEFGSPDLSAHNRSVGIVLRAYEDAGILPSDEAHPPASLIGKWVRDFELDPVTAVLLFDDLAVKGKLGKGVPYVATVLRSQWRETKETEFALIGDLT